MAEDGPLGFIGIGSMGGPMAKHMLDNGHPLVVRDVNPGAVQYAVGHGAGDVRETHAVGLTEAAVTEPLRIEGRQGREKGECGVTVRLGLTDDITPKGDTDVAARMLHHVHGCTHLGQGRGQGERVENRGPGADHPSTDGRERHKHQRRQMGRRWGFSPLFPTCVSSFSHRLKRLKRLHNRPETCCAYDD